MKILKYQLKKDDEQIIKIPERSEILDIQLQNGIPVMWAKVDPESEDIEIKINMYGTGWEINDDDTTEDIYLSTVQDGSFVWHFFMNYEL